MVWQGICPPLELRKGEFDWIWTGDLYWMFNGGALVTTVDRTKWRGREETLVRVHASWFLHDAPRVARTIPDAFPPPLGRTSQIQHCREIQRPSWPITPIFDGPAGWRITSPGRKRTPSFWIAGENGYNL
jgi:hypothetical protein